MNSTQKELTRFLIRRYCERAEVNKARIHYEQFRPMTHFGKSPSYIWTTDCSGFVTGTFRWADLHTKFAVNDPNGRKYDGTGNTTTLLYNNRTRRISLDRQFFIGDIALYGSSLSDTKHVVICRKNGDLMHSIWTSHGSEAGPYSVYLEYRSDLLCVVRSQDLI